MPSANIRETMLRHWRLMELLPRHPRFITIKTIHERLEAAGFKATRRTVERDLQGLMESGFAIVADTTQEPYLWSWDAAAPALTLPVPSVPDALLLGMVRDYVGPMLPPQMLDALRPYLDRAVQVLDDAKTHNRLAAWRDKVHAVLPTQALIAPEVDADVHRAVSEALMNEMQLEIVYDSMSGKKGQLMTVHPHAVIHRGQMAYLVGSCWDYADMRRLAMHRIREAKNTFIPMTKQPDFNLTKYLAGGHGDFGEGEMRELDIKVSPGLAEYLTECKLATNQKLTRTKAPEGWFRLRANLPDTPQLRSWLLGQGQEVIGEL
ncbi:MAG: WYL domain-containing transcriptional regulator [Rhodoferax sp.]|nr:WYL domain-containing transcriptional regulator [Rhodoferax sp.]MBP9059010.1 WYL domain-containing transcriptional regulator [Rhodoferax sp.]